MRNIYKSLAEKHSDEGSFWEIRT